MDGERDSYNKGGDMKDDEDVTKEASLFSIYHVTQGRATSQDAENKRLGCSELIGVSTSHLVFSRFMDHSGRGWRMTTRKECIVNSSGQLHI